MKKLFAMLLALTMILSLTACGGSKKEEPAKEEITTESTSGEPAPLTINFPTASSTGSLYAVGAAITNLWDTEIS